MADEKKTKTPPAPAGDETPPAGDDQTPPAGDGTPPAGDETPPADPNAPKRVDMKEHTFKVELFVDNPGTSRGRSLDKSTTYVGTIQKVADFVAEQVRLRDKAGTAGNIARIDMRVEQPAGAAPTLV